MPVEDQADPIVPPRPGIPWNSSIRTITRVLCFPAASGSAPRIVLEHYQDGGIRVACRSAGWFPQPQVLWQDHCGQHLPSLSENITQDESGLFATESILILTRSASQEVACVVRPALQSQEKESSFYISGKQRTGASSW